MMHYFAEPDKERSDITWEVLGDEETEEIVVRAKVGQKIYEERQRSPIAFPQMCERIFGIDESDLQMSFEMSNRIYERILKDEESE